MPAPPTIRDLIRDPIYRRYLSTSPRVYATQLTSGARPWSLYVAIEAPERPSGVRWRVARCPTYPDAYKRLKDTLSAPNPGQLDLCISSRSVEYGPPPGFNWTTHTEWAGTEWCSRCRRPSYFRTTHGRHAFLPRPGKSGVVAPPVVRTGVQRCYFCGIAIDGMYRYYTPVPLPTPKPKDTPVRFTKSRRTKVPA